MISYPAILLRLGVALVLGALIGVERESKEHAAGLRTMALVSLGSALFMIVSEFGFVELIGTPHIQLDPSRIASYVVAGIGFLGAGSIFLSPQQERVKGLTTAAAIWLVAGIGLASGGGMLLEAITATVLGLIVLIVLRILEQLFLPRKALSIQSLRIEATPVTGQFIANVYDTCKRTGVTIESLDVRPEKENVVVTVVCRMRDTADFTHTIGELQALSEVRAVHADLRSSSLSATID